MQYWKLLPITFLVIQTLHGDFIDAILPFLTQECQNTVQNLRTELQENDPFVIYEAIPRRNPCRREIRTVFRKDIGGDPPLFLDLIDRFPDSLSILNGFGVDLDNQNLYLSNSQNIIAEQINATGTTRIRTMRQADLILTGGSQFTQLDYEGPTGFMANTRYMKVTQQFKLNGTFYNVKTISNDPSEAAAVAIKELILGPEGTYSNLNEFGMGGAATAVFTLRVNPDREPRIGRNKWQIIGRNTARIREGHTGSAIAIDNLLGTVFLLEENTALVEESSVGNAFAIGFYIEDPSVPCGLIRVNNRGVVDGSNSFGCAGAVDTPLALTYTDIILENSGSTKNGGIGVLQEFNNLTLNGRTFLLKDHSPCSDGTGRGVFAKVFQSITIGECGKVLLDDYQPSLWGGSRSVILEAQVITVGNRGLLGGSGTVIAKQHLLNSGTVRANGLRVRTPLFQQTPTSTLEIVLRDSCHTPLQVEGHYALNGTIRFVPDCVFSVCPGDTFAVVQATEGVSGRFSCIQNCLPWEITPEICYQPNSVLVTLIGPCPTLCEYMGNFTQTLMTSITDTNNFLIKRELQRIQQRVTSKDKNKKMGNFYMAPIGSVGKSDPTCGQVGFDFWSAGGVMGADYACAQGGIGGLALFENIQSYRPTHCWGKFRTERAHASLYATYVPSGLPAFSLDLMVGGGYDWYRFHRFVGNQTAEGSPHGYEADGMLSLEYTFTCDKNSHIIPMANLQYIYLHVNDYREQGTCFRNICYASQRARSLSTLLGLWGDHTWQSAHPVTAAVSLGWQREYWNHDRTLHYSGGCLELEGAKRNNVLAGVDLNVQVSACCKLEGSYELIWNRQFRRNGFLLGINSSF